MLFKELHLLSVAPVNDVKKHEKEINLTTMIILTRTLDLVKLGLNMTD